MNTLVRNTICSILMLVAIAMAFSHSYFSEFWTSVIYATILTIGVYMVYDAIRENYKRRIKFFRDTFKVKVTHKEEMNTFSYFLLDKEVTREQILELVQLTYELSSRKANKYVVHFESESRNQDER